jgi:hypothetical protein
MSNKREKTLKKTLKEENLLEKKKETSTAKKEKDEEEEKENFYMEVDKYEEDYLSEMDWEDVIL